MNLRKRRNATPLICRIDACGFAAVMVALVAMFVAPALIVTDWKGVSVKVPTVNHWVEMTGANREDAIIISVLVDGAIYCEHDKLAPAELPQRIRQHLKVGAERKVYLRVDERAKYGSVVEVLEMVRSVGLENIAFEVRGQASAAN